MKKMTLSLLAAAALGAISLGSASAMPIGNMAAAQGTSLVQDVRLVCNRYNRCYNTTRRAYRSGNYYAQPYYGSRGYYAQPAYGYYGGPRVGIGIGPVGIGIF